MDYDLRLFDFLFPLAFCLVEIYLVSFRFFNPISLSLLIFDIDLFPLAAISQYLDEFGVLNWFLLEEREIE
jgi:hypothetical protein